MKKLTEYEAYEEVIDQYRWDMLWELFDGDETNLNIAHECLDRHADKGTAIRIKFADGHVEEYTFEELSEWSSRFANFLEMNGVQHGDRVAVMLDPSLEFYACMFGTIKGGAVAVPLFTLFGPEALEQRINDCEPRVLVLSEEKAHLAEMFPEVRAFEVDTGFLGEISKESSSYQPRTTPMTWPFFNTLRGPRVNFQKPLSTLNVRWSPLL